MKYAGIKLDVMSLWLFACHRAIEERLLANDYYGWVKYEFTIERPNI
jgi:hypothetical protein